MKRLVSEMGWQNLKVKKKIKKIKMKLSELRAERLKQELSKLALPTMGKKSELQRRIREELWNCNIDVDTYDFEDEEEREPQSSATSSGIEINSLLADMMEKMQVENQKLLAESRKDSEQRMETIQQKLLLKIEELEATTEKLEKILESFSKGVTVLKKRCRVLKKPLTRKY